MTIGIFDPFSGISGDMTLGALVSVGLDPEWLRALPTRLGLEGVSVDIRDVQRAGLACTKVDFEIPPQPHGRHLHQIRQIVERSDAPACVKQKADQVFLALATVEGEMHGVSPDRVHLHEVGAVDAILDVVGSVWGLELLGVGRVHCSTIRVGDGEVRAAHGILPVPAPATMKLLEGQRVRPGPDHAGELVTPTGAALIHVLSAGAPGEYIPRRSGFGAGTREFPDRANALRFILADAVPSAADGGRSLVLLAADIDDMSGEYLAAVGDRVRAAGALDVVLTATTMKKGRPGTRIEVLCEAMHAAALEDLLLEESTTIGVRRVAVERRALPRVQRKIEVLGHPLDVKLVVLPKGGLRGKPEFDDVRRVADATKRPLRDIFELATKAIEQLPPDGV